MIRQYSRMTRLEMEQVNKDETLILIPIGSLEQHGNHLPLGTDTMIGEQLIDYIKDELDDDFSMLVFPSISIGLSTEHKNFCGSITLKPDTLYHMLEDVCRHLAYHGFKKIVFLNSHGGNTPVIQVLSRELRVNEGITIFCIQSGFWDNPDVKNTLSEGNIWDFHGGEMETSMVMAIDEDIVHLDVAREGVPTAFVKNKHFGLFGPISISWIGEDWKDQEGNPIGIGGNPVGATAEKGKIIFKSFAESIARGLIEISRWEA